MRSKVPRYSGAVFTCPNFKRTYTDPASEIVGPVSPPLTVLLQLWKKQLFSMPNAEHPNKGLERRKPLLCTEPCTKHTHLTLFIQLLYAHSLGSLTTIVLPSHYFESTSNIKIDNRTRERQRKRRSAGRKHWDAQIHKCLCLDRCVCQWPKVYLSVSIHNSLLFLFSNIGSFSSNCSFTVSIVYILQMYRTYKRYQNALIA